MSAPLEIIGMPSIYPNAREITFVGATGENKINLPDNLASALDITEGSNSYMDIVTTNGSELIKFGKNVTINANFALEGYSTGRNILRVLVISITPGATAGTNIDILVRSAAEGTFNNPTITDADDLADNSSSGSFALNAGSTDLTFNITENIVGVLPAVMILHNINDSSTSELYTIHASISSDNIVLKFFLRPSVSAVDILTIMDAGDQMWVAIPYFTST